MALAILSPWPTTPAALSAARLCLSAVILGDLTDSRLDALGMASSAMVENYTPDAPQVAKNEAVVRLAAYLEARMPKSVQSVSVSGVRINYRDPQSKGDLMGGSGARSLLLPWRVHRALAIEEVL